VPQPISRTYAAIWLRPLKVKAPGSWIGLILNELVTNVLKYAFPGETKGTADCHYPRRSDEAPQRSSLASL
jgi:hypothetical protein